MLLDRKKIYGGWIDDNHPKFHDGHIVYLLPGLSPISTPRFFQEAFSIRVGS
jgi:hypothetical protein